MKKKCIKHIKKPQTLNISRNIFEKKVYFLAIHTKTYKILVS